MSCLTKQIIGDRAGILLTLMKKQNELRTKKIYEALVNDEFFIEYLPIMRIDGKECLGAEALIRWKQAEEIIPPMDFIPVIENTVLSGPITYWLIENIVKELGEWLRAQDHAFISINIPPELLGRGGLWYAASKNGLLDVANKIVVEVTERRIPDNLGLQALLEAKELVFRICLDDVSVTNEKLMVYARSNIDLIKLDKTIADKMLKPDWKAKEIAALAPFTRHTAINIIAEGVETEYQRDIFQELGVPMAQGWYFSHPLSAEGLLEFFHSLISEEGR